jgi:hypothetical protein
MSKKKKSTSTASKALALGTALSLGTFGFTAVGTGAAFSAPTANTAAASLNTTKVIKLANGKTRIRVDLADNLRGKTVFIRTSRMVDGKRVVVTLGRVTLNRTGQAVLTVSRKIRVDDRLVVTDGIRNIVNSKITVIDDRTPVVPVPVPTPTPTPAPAPAPAPVTPVAPAIATATFTGTPTVGQVLTAGSTGVTGTPTPTLTYAWQISDNGTSGWAAISGATSSTYTPVTGDATKFIRVVVTATNATSSASATSTATTAVAAADTDDTPPVIVAPTDADVTTTEAATWEAPDATATDDTDETVDITVVYSSEDDGAEVTDLASAQAHLETVGNTVTVTYSATDEAGNVATPVTAVFSAVAAD